MNNKPNNYLTYSLLKSLPYSQGEEMQLSYHNDIANDNNKPNHIIFAEHLPVITCGKSGHISNLLVSQDTLTKKNISFYHNQRGGDITYHGPGQWTIYPIIRLSLFNRDLHFYLRSLEECVINFLADYNINAQRRDGLTGVWIGSKKICAIGIAVRKWISWHGFSFNVQPDLYAFRNLIVPCGIPNNQGEVTSLSELTGQTYDMSTIAQQILKKFAYTAKLEII